MRKFWLLAAAILIAAFAPCARGQTNFLVGATAGDSFSNFFGGLAGRIEIPFARRLEIDASGEVSPLLAHAALGSGYSYGATGLAWIAHSLALDGGMETSEYAVTATAKQEYFAHAGITYRRLWMGTPTRFSVAYVRETNNGIMPNGDETNHLQGASVTFDSRAECWAKFCLRVITRIEGGRTLQQGNPQCDGTFGATGGPNNGPCPRQGALGGGASMSAYFEFPRRRATENDPF